MLVLKRLFRKSALEFRQIEGKKSLRALVQIRVKITRGCKSKSELEFKAELNSLSYNL